MSLSARISPAAARDARAAAEWYNRERPGLGRRFLAEVKRVSLRIRDAPLQLPLVDEGVRRALLRTFPYALFFTVETDVVVVVAVVHLHRHPDHWREGGRAG